MTAVELRNALDSPYRDADITGLHLIEGYRMVADFPFLVFWQRIELLCHLTEVLTIIGNLHFQAVGVEAPRTGFCERTDIAGGYLLRLTQVDGSHAVVTIEAQPGSHGVRIGAVDTVHQLWCASKGIVRCRISLQGDGLERRLGNLDMLGPFSRLRRSTDCQGTDVGILLNLQWAFIFLRGFRTIQAIEYRSLVGSSQIQFQTTFLSVAF